MKNNTKEVKAAHQAFLSPLIEVRVSCLAALDEYSERHRKVRIKKVKKDATVPIKGSSQAAGLDLYACIEHEVKIKPKSSEMMGCGIAFEIPKGYFGAVYARSGLGMKEGLRPPNCVGIIDSDYRGEVQIALYNDSDETRVIKPKERIAQIVIMPYLDASLFEGELSRTERGENGFGSTGKK